jgi:hypothetical protein
MGVQEMIVKVCDETKELLLAKNKKYGNSALEPIRIFSKASTREQLLVRIDDKLSRIKTSGTEGPDEDTLADLAGYLNLLRVHDRLEAEKKLKEAYTKGLILQNPSDHKYVSPSETERIAGFWKVHEVSSPDPMINTQTTVYPPSMTLTEAPQFQGFSSSTMSVTSSQDFVLIPTGHHGYPYERK